MPKKNPQSSSEDEGDAPQPPPQSKGAIPKSRTYSGPQASTSKGDEGRKASGMKSEDEGDSEDPQGVWEGRTRSSRKDSKEEGRESFFRRLRRGTSKSKSPTNKKEKKSRSPSTEDERDKRRTSQSPGSKLKDFLKGRKRSKSPKKPATPVPEMEEDVEDEQPAEVPPQATGGHPNPISPIEELRGILHPTNTAGYARSMKQRPGPDMEELLPGPEDSKPIESRADQYVAKFDIAGQPDCIEAKPPKGSPPVTEDDTASSSISDSSSRNLPMDQEDFANFSDNEGSQDSKAKDKKK